MILVSTSLETIDQLRARNKTNKLSKAKRLTVQNVENLENYLDVSKDSEGLLW
ncbi:hypothetical protein NW733_00655 [Mycoplasmopsis felis]|nr:hypothetical protein [Mycoplasmopsis felis]MCU9931275.1 hypothetical protein [Mycoplasmopsis felis]